MSLGDKFWSRVDKSGACWIWTAGKTTAGYGVVWGRGPKPVYAHRLAYEDAIGPIPDGLTIDHVKARGCTSRACVNPAHLEAVTQKVNALRGDGPPSANAIKTKCPMGHPLVQIISNSRPQRDCIPCRRMRSALHDVKRHPSPAYIARAIRHSKITGIPFDPTPLRSNARDEADLRQSPKTWGVR